MTGAREIVAFRARRYSIKMNGQAMTHAWQRAMPYYHMGGIQAKGISI